MRNQLLPLFKITLALLLINANLFSQAYRVPWAHEFIHVNDYRVAVGHCGSNFMGNFSEIGSLVPFTSQRSAGTIYASAVWITGEDEDGKNYCSYETYRNNYHFIPGPLPEDETPLSYSEMLNWNRIFKVSGSAILAHIQDASDGTVDRPLESVFGWPAAGNKHFEDIHGFRPEYGPEGGAYFVEVPGAVNGIYEPELGEYPHIEKLAPDIIPGEIAWAVYNNADNQQFYNLSDSTMTVEIQQTSYSFTCPGTLLYQNVFHDYKVISRTNENMTKFKFGLWMDPSLGCYEDDYIGCDPDRNTFYVYNEDAEDGAIGSYCVQSNLSYLDQPPVQTITFLNQKMDAFVMFHNPGVNQSIRSATHDPRNPEEVIRYMDATWRDGTPLTRGGSGYNPLSTDTVKYIYPDNPNLKNGWSLYQEEDIPLADRRIVGIVETSLAPKSSKTFTVAFGYHNHPDSNFITNVNYALKRVDSLQLLYDQGEMGCRTDHCSCDCVWPGDANSDGRVDYLDAVNIIQGLHDSGTPRPGPYPFTPKDVNDWTASNFQDINSKYADIDGSGEVNLDDLRLLEKYLGHKNYCADEPNENCEEGDDVYLEIDDWGTEFPTSLGRGAIKVKNLDDFWGVSFKLKYDRQLVRLITDLSPKDWKNQNLGVIKFYHRVMDQSRGEHQIVFFNDAGINAEPESYQNVTIASFIIGPEDMQENYPDRYVKLEVCDFTVYYEDGTSRYLPSRAVKFLVQDSMTTSTRSFTRDPALVKVYPNPGYGQYTVETNYQIERVDVFNAQGQWIRSAYGNEVNIQDSRKGIYFFKIYGSSGELGFSKVILH